MSTAIRHDQSVHAERYAQPFRTIARIVGLFVRANRRKRAVSKVEKVWFSLFCRPLSRFCVLPDVLLIGASKCGTSSMAAHLSSHPDCLPPFYKEVRYFDSSKIHPSDLATFRAYFPTKARRKAKELVSGRKAWITDFSPTYYDYPHAPRRIAEMLGTNVRLIMMVRNPVDRAFSQYCFHRAKGLEQEPSFERALDLEESRVAGEAQKQLDDETYFSRSLNRYGYVARGMYLQYIKNWHKYFDPSQLLIIRFEDFRSSPQQSMDEICDFLGSPHCKIREEVHNISKGGGRMTAAARARLIEVFRQHNKELSGYLSRDFAWDS